MRASCASPRRAPTNTMGELRDSTDTILESADGGGDRGNFAIVHSVEPGVFYMHVTADAVGTYFPLAEMGEFEDADEERTAPDVPDAAMVAMVAFQTHISAPIIQAKCVNCHVQGGLSGNTRLVFVPSTNADHLSHNLNAFREFLRRQHEEGSDGAARVLTKVTGGDGHGGSVQIEAGSADYQNLATFLALLEEG